MREAWIASLAAIPRFLRGVPGLAYALRQGGGLPLRLGQRGQQDDWHSQQLAQGGEGPVGGDDPHSAASLEGDQQGIVQIAKRHLDQQVRLPLPIVVQKEIPRHLLHFLELQLGGQLRPPAGEQVAQVGRLTQGVLDHPVREIAGQIHPSSGQDRFSFNGLAALPFRPVCLTAGVLPDADRAASRRRGRAA